MVAMTTMTMMKNLRMKNPPGKMIQMMTMRTTLAVYAQSRSGGIHAMMLKALILADSLANLDKLLERAAEEAIIKIIGRSRTPGEPVGATKASSSSESREVLASAVSTASSSG